MKSFSPAVIALVFTAILATPSSGQNRSDAVVVLESEFSVNAGGTLSVNTDDADIIVRTSRSSNTAHVEVLLSAKDMERARAYFETLNFTARQSNGRIEVESTKPPVRYRNWHWRGGARILVHIDIPERFDYDIRTSDGDIAAESIRGSGNIHSSDGDLRLASLDGDNIQIKTSDGDIFADGLSADVVSVVTSDGDIRIESLRSKEATVRTSDGDIIVESITGAIFVKSSDGDIRLGDATGPSVNVRTSDGDITVDRLLSNDSEIVTSEGEIFINYSEGNMSVSSSDGSIVLSLDKFGTVNARSGDGDIILKVPNASGADLELRGSRVDITSGHQFTGTLEKRYASGMMNGGGPAVRATSSDGHIIVSN